MKLAKGQGNAGGDWPVTFKNSYLGCFLIGEFWKQTSRFLIMSAIN
jgi:hypothetical protein